MNHPTVYGGSCIKRDKALPTAATASDSEALPYGLPLNHNEALLRGLSLNHSEVRRDSIKSAA